VISGEFSREHFLIGQSFSAKLAINALPCVSGKTFTQYRTTKRIKEQNQQTPNLKVSILRAVKSTQNLAENGPVKMEI
jgi:hypothetical protein